MAPELAEALRPLAARFLERCDQFGVDRPHEDGALEPFRERLSRRLGLPWPSSS